MQKEIYNWYNYTIIILFPKTQVKGTKLGSLGWWLYCIWHLFFPWKGFYFNRYFIRLNLSPFTLMKYFRLLYLERNSSCLALMAPLLFFLIKSTASSYFIPSSINAVATNTGALRVECNIIRRCLQCWCSAARLTCQAQWHSEHQHMCLGFPWTLRLPERATVQWSPGKKYKLRQKTTCETCVDGRNVLIWTREICFSRGGEKFVPKQLPE